MRSALLLVLLIWAPALFAEADCNYNFVIQNTSRNIDNVTVFAPGPLRAINNKINPCTAWTLNYNTQGFTAWNVQLESAPATAVPSVPGTFVIYNGVISNGANPSANVTPYTLSISGYNPFLRINLLSYTGTGSINFKLLGWKSSSYISWFSRNELLKFNVLTLVPIE